MFTRGRELLTNLNVGGAFIQAQDGYAVGSVVSLRFSLGSRHITSTTVVRSVVPGRGMGVEFLDLSPDNMERLVTFIERA